MVPSRKNKPPFSQEECIALARTYAEHHSILNGTVTSTITHAKKKASWEKVAAAVNAVSGTYRTVEDIKNKHKNMKKNTKTVTSDNKKDYVKPGGGKGHVTELEELKALQGRQIELIEEQLVEYKKRGLTLINIEKQLGELNDIEKEKLKIKKGKGWR